MSPQTKTNIATSCQHTENSWKRVKNSGLKRDLNFVRDTSKWAEKNLIQIFNSIWLKTSNNIEKFADNKLSGITLTTKEKKIIFQVDTSLVIQNSWLKRVYAGEVMTSFNHVMMLTRGNWFQTNTLEHEHDESDSCVHLLCVFYQW